MGAQHSQPQDGIVQRRSRPPRRRPSCGDCTPTWRRHWRTRPAEQRRRKGQRGREKVGGRQSRRQTRVGHPRARARRPRGVRPLQRHQTRQQRRPLPLYSRAGPERAMPQPKPRPRARAGATERVAPPTRAPLRQQQLQHDGSGRHGHDGARLAAIPLRSQRDWQPLWQQVQVQRQSCAQRVESRWRSSPSWGGLPSCGSLDGSCRPL